MAAARLVQAAGKQDLPPTPVTQGSTQGKESLGTCICRPPPRPNPMVAAGGSPSQPIAPHRSEAGAMRENHQCCSSNSKLLRLFVFSKLLCVAPCAPTAPNCKTSHDFAWPVLTRHEPPVTHLHIAKSCVCFVYTGAGSLRFCTRAFARVAARQMRPAALYGHGRSALAQRSVHDGLSGAHPTPNFALQGLQKSPDKGAPCRRGPWAKPSQGFLPCSAPPYDEP